MEHDYRQCCESDDEFDPLKFSSFVELQKANIRIALSNHGYSKSDFAKWVYDGILETNENVRHIPRILSNEKAKQIFFVEGSKKAIALLNAPEDSFDLSSMSIYDLADHLTSKLGKISLREVKSLHSSPDGDSRLSLESLKSELDALFEEFEE